MGKIPVQHLSEQQTREEVSRWQNGEIEAISDQAAQTVASWFASPGYRRTEFATLSTTGRCTEMLPLEIHCEASEYAHDDPNGEALEALAAYADLFVPTIIGCWSTFGHTFLTTDQPLEEDCLHCGGRWKRVRRADNPKMADYQARNGDDPIECPSGKASHLYHGEAPCQADNGNFCAAAEDGPCEHLATEHGCNCLHCTG